MRFHHGPLQDHIQPPTPTASRTNRTCRLRGIVCSRLLRLLRRSRHACLSVRNGSRHPISAPIRRGHRHAHGPEGKDGRHQRPSPQSSPRQPEPTRVGAEDAIRAPRVPAPHPRADHSASRKRKQPERAIPGRENRGLRCGAASGPTPRGTDHTAGTTGVALVGGRASAALTAGSTCRSAPAAARIAKPIPHSSRAMPTTIAKSDRDSAM